jgi:hypothetical protein
MKQHTIHHEQIECNKWRATIQYWCHQARPYLVTDRLEQLTD